ncbi:MAG: ankyrin repeat domain-containing protein [Planctomycetota bacterium]
MLGQPRFHGPVNLRFDNPHWIGAWRDLYGYKYNDLEKEHLSLLFKEKQRIKRQQGENYPTWVLDKLGIETALGPWQELGLGQTPPRFYWVALVDDFWHPFSGIHYTSDIKPAATLEEYTKTVVTPAIESFKQDGAIAIKFIVILYWRPLNFQKVSSVEAASVYEQLLQEKEVSISEQRKLQDYLFRYITQEAGRLDLKVHIYSGIGADPYFNISGSNPMLLESVFNDPDQRNTKFVINHGGGPFDKEAGAMLIKPNVYVDFSFHTFFRSTHALSKTIRAWLEWYPEKVLFGTKAIGVSPLLGWEERAWLSTKTARNALAIALTEMMNDGQISRNRAFELAEMVLRTNAIRLYDLRTKLLVEKGADISLHTAARQGLQEELKKLIEKGTDVNAKDSSGQTALHYAAREGYKEIIELLLENGADVNIRVKYYNLTTAEIAMNNNHNKVVELLIAKGADISPLHLALYMKDEAKAKSLIEGGADVNERTPYGNTPMHRAVVAGLKDIVELLIAKGANVNAKDNWDWTPLHSAAEEGHRELAELLIAKGANVNARDPLDRTPLWYAQEEGHTKIIELLRKHGAKE